MKKDEIGIALGGFGYNLGAAGLTTYLTYFYTDHMLLSAASVSLIFLISRMIDAFTDLMVGYLIDRTNTKWGRVRPWLLWMAAPALLSVIAVYYIPNLARTGRTIYAFVTYNLMAFFYLTCLQMPVNTMVSVLAADAKQRIRLNQYFGFAFSVAAVLVNLFAARIMDALGGGSVGFLAYFAVCAGIGVLLMLGCFFLTTERVPLEKKKPIRLREACYMLFHNPYAIWIIIVTVLIYMVVAGNSMMSYYTIYILKGEIDVGILMSFVYVGMAVGIPIFAPLAKKIGAVRCCAAGYFIVAASYLPLLIRPESVCLNYVSAILRSLGIGAGTGVMNAIRAEVVTYGQWKFGYRMDGIIFSSASFGMKVGSGIGAAAVALLLSLGGYVARAEVQQASALTAIQVGYIHMPLVLSLLVGGLLMAFNLEKKMPEIESEMMTKG